MSLRLVALALCAAVLSSFSALAQTESPPTAPEAKTRAARPVAVIVTSMGTIEAELFSDQAPVTVDNFLGLAEGTKEWTDPATGKKVKRPFYDGLGFHRIIAGFMVQGGCPLGNGTGGPGYSFKDEIDGKALGLDREKVMAGGGQPHPWLLVRSQADFSRNVVSPVLRDMGISGQEELQERAKEVQARIDAMTLLELYGLQGYRYDDSLDSTKPLRGVLAMANSGPGTNGSQFFINLVDTPHLTGKHTVFGKVVRGMEVVDKIGKVATDAQGRPSKPVTIKTVRRKKILGAEESK